MDKEETRKLKAQHKQKEKDTIRASIPMSIEELNSLLSILRRKQAPECDHMQKEAIGFIRPGDLNPEVIVP